VWLMSPPHETDKDGHVRAALFRACVKDGEWERIAGPSREVMNAQQGQPDQPNDPGHFGQVVADSGNRIFVNGLKANVMLMMPAPGKTTGNKEIELSFQPRYLTLADDTHLMAAGKGRITMIDTQKLEVARTIEFDGEPSALCAAGARYGLVAVQNSNLVVVADFVFGKLAPPIDLERKNGRADMADARRDRNLYRIEKLVWCDKPGRLVGLGWEGYLPFAKDVPRLAGAATTASAPATSPAARP
jgi:hypothetical protein